MYLEDVIKERMVPFVAFIMVSASESDLSVPRDVIRYIGSILAKSFFSKYETRDDGLVSSLFFEHTPKPFRAYPGWWKKEAHRFNVIIKNIDRKTESFERVTCKSSHTETYVTLIQLHNLIHITASAGFTTLKAEYNGIVYRQQSDYYYKCLKYTNTTPTRRMQDLVELCDTIGIENVVFIAECACIKEKYWKDRLFI